MQAEGCNLVGFGISPLPRMPLFQHQWSVLGRDAMTSRPSERIHSQVPGLGRQVPGSGVQVSGTGSGPAPAPEPDNPYLAPDHLRPETWKCISVSHLCTSLPYPPPATWGYHLPPVAMSFPRYFFPFFGSPKIPPLGNVTILYSPPEAATQRLYNSCGSLEVE